MREISPKVAIVMMRRANETFDASDCDSVLESLIRPEILVAAVDVRSTNDEHSPTDTKRPDFSNCVHRPSAAHGFEMMAGIVG
jgi:hypothetical protein